MSENVDQPVPVITAIQPIPNKTTRKFTFRRPVMPFTGNSSLVFKHYLCDLLNLNNQSQIYVNLNFVNLSFVNYLAMNPRNEILYNFLYHACFSFFQVISTTPPKKMNFSLSCKKIQITYIPQKSHLLRKDEK